MDFVPAILSNIDSAFLISRLFIASIRSNILAHPVVQIAASISSWCICFESANNARFSSVDAMMWLCDIFFSQSSRTESIISYSLRTFLIISVSRSGNLPSQRLVEYIFPNRFTSQIFTSIFSSSTHRSLSAWKRRKWSSGRDVSILSKNATKSVVLSRLSLPPDTINNLFSAKSPPERIFCATVEPLSLIVLRYMCSILRSECFSPKRRIHLFTSCSIPYVSVPVRSIIFFFIECSIGKNREE